MRIRQAEEKDQPAWDDFVGGHPDGLAYHYFAWKAAVARAYGFRGIYLVAERDGEVCGVLPLIHMKSPLFAGRLVSLPYCDVGGCLARDEECQSALLDAARVIALQEGVRGLEYRWATAPKEGIGNNASGGKVRMILDLPRDSATLLAGLKAKLRSQVRKPIRDGLSTRLGGMELVNDFYGVFAENMRDLGSPVHSKKWIEAVVGASSGAARIGMVYAPDGRPAAGGVILLHPQTVSIPWASSLRRYNHLNANMLLYWSFLAFAADGGYARFDFGRSTLGEGTCRFKEQWGARPSPLYWQSLPAPESTAVRGNLARTGRRIAEQIWSRLPIGLTTLLGPALRRNISL